MEGIGAHDHHAVGEIAEDAAGVLARDLRLPPGPLRVAQFRAVKGIALNLTPLRLPMMTTVGAFSALPSPVIWTGCPSGPSKKQGPAMVCVRSDVTSIVSVAV